MLLRPRARTSRSAKRSKDFEFESCLCQERGGVLEIAFLHIFFLYNRYKPSIQKLAEKEFVAVLDGTLSGAQQRVLPSKKF